MPWLHFIRSVEDSVRDSANCLNGGIKYFLSQNIGERKYLNGNNLFLAHLLQSQSKLSADYISAEYQSSLREVTSEGRLSSSAFETQGAARLATRSHERMKEAFSHSKTATNVKERIQQRNASFKEPPEPGNGASMRNLVTIGIVASLSSGILRSIANLHTYGLEKLHHWIESRPAGMPLLTVANHRKTYFDHSMFVGVFVQSICVSRIHCFRAFSIMAKCYQLEEGDWVHVFPEGKVCQKSLGLIRRGVGKMIAVAKERLGFAPIIVPIYHEGMENVMPQRRETNELVSILPFSGHDVYVLVGDPIGIEDILEKYKNILSSPDEGPKTMEDTPERIKMYEEICDRISFTLSNLRQELRRKYHGFPFEKGIVFW
ncbi:N-acylphosphatidylethanolamine synthase [Galdieria sulphuraria]|nr:N-acylphosphatidylethanolamine synthase [Galdieria sulphuraria]